MPVIMALSYSQNIEHDSSNKSQ